MDSPSNANTKSTKKTKDCSKKLKKPKIPTPITLSAKLTSKNHLPQKTTTHQESFKQSPTGKSNGVSFCQKHKRKEAP
jgi:hypothetical protein